jgi:hypothetical protein
MDNTTESSSHVAQAKAQTNPNTKPNTRSKKVRGFSPYALKVLKFEQLVGDPQTIVSIKNYKFLASYNWVKVNEPTILVPGILFHSSDLSCC